MTRGCDLLISILSSRGKNKIKRSQPRFTRQLLQGSHRDGSQDWTWPACGRDAFDIMPPRSTRYALDTAIVRDAAMSTASMTLFHNPLSPYVRKVMVLLHETGQQDRVALQASVLTPVSPDTALLEDNPLGKIPALRLADGNVIHDSRVILEYLDHQHVGNPLIPREGSARWRRLTLASLADGIMDAAVLIRYEVALRAPEKHWDEWLDGQRDKIRRSLALLEKDAIAELTSHFDVAAISVACALGYLDLRHPDLQWRAVNPLLAAWYFEVSQRASMLATMPKV